MKKCLTSLLLVLLLAISLFALPVSSASVYYPDVDGDGKIGSSDARLILRNAVGLTVFSDAQKDDADYDKDGAITAEDARTALRTAVGLHIDMLAQSRIFRSDKFICSGTITKNGASEAFSLATAGKNLLITTYIDFGLSLGNESSGVVSFSVLCENGNLYFVNPAAEIYCPLTEELLAMLGFNTAEEYLANIRLTDLVFKLSAEDEPSNTETVRLDVYGTTATCYSFNTVENTIQKHYVDAKGNLIRVLDFDKHGGLIAYIDIESITSAVPEDITTLPEDYIETGYFDFILSLMSNNSVIIQ